MSRRTTFGAVRYRASRQPSRNDHMQMRLPRDWYSLCEAFFVLHGYAMPASLQSEVFEIKTVWEHAHGS